MLLKQLLESPKTSSNLVVYDPFQDVDREELVKEVIGLANADVEGPRNILFGINSGAVDGNGIVGIPESVVADLKKAHRQLSAVIEPVLHLAFIFDRINGKLVGALEIDGCDFGPYFVGHDLNGSLSLGQCWVREGWELRAVERAELMLGTSSAPTGETEKVIDKADIDIGFNDEPECKLLEMDIPDTSNPPFAQEHFEATRTSKIKQAIKDTVGTMTTQILKFGQGGPELAESGAEPVADVCDEADKVLADAKNHYYFEERALQLNLCARNKGDDDLEDVGIELGFPRLPDFDVADRLHTSPFDKRSPAEIKNLGYPEVVRRDDAIFVRGKIGMLAQHRSEPVFRCALRLAVGPRMQGRKIAVRYTLRAPNGQELDNGRLKIKFGEVPA